jgi:hypothetical protein
VSAGGSANAGMVGMAFPGTFMLDRQGRVTSRFFEDVYSERNTVSSVMLRIGAAKSPVSATKVSGAHLDLTTYPSDAAIAAGNRFTLVLDVVPRPRMHVYAPGAAGYRVIALRVDEQPFIRTVALEYPPSETYFFAPLKERVPVYQKPFTLRQQLVLEASQQAQASLRGKDSLTITGTLDYQACDDKLCFNPASLPLTWTLSLRPLITEKPQPRN